MASQTKIFDHDLRPLTELNGVPATPRSWVLNDIGECDLGISTADPKCTEINFQFGNLLYIKHIPTKDASNNVNGQLPDWVGMLLPPRTWDNGVLHVTGYSAEVILAFCPMPLRHISGDPRMIFLKILEYANEFIRQNGGGIVIQPGIIETTGDVFSDDLSLSAREHIKTLTANAGMYWDVTGKIDQYGNLALYANLYKTKGVTTDLTLTNLNSEAAAPLLTEQGNIYNVVIGYNQASTEPDRIKTIGTNTAAASDYGPFGMNNVFSGLDDSASVLTASQEIANGRGRPVKIIGRTAIDFRDTFTKLETGNVIEIIENNAGFAPGGGFGVKAQARILSITYNDLSNKAPLNVEVI